MIEDARDCIVIKIKAGARFDDRDLHGLRAFLAATPGCRAGIVAFNGTRAISLGDRMWAIPITTLLS
ncbi:MAG: hypothetical protein SGI86_09495 [Deltaproteobacteria bacterium]|nr:hypothetical protein [Deltaproteobacteria bacterium]